MGEAENQRERGCFSGAVWPEQAEGLTGLDSKSEALEGEPATEMKKPDRVTFSYFDELDRTGHGVNENGAQRWGTSLRETKQPELRIANERRLDLVKHEVQPKTDRLCEVTE